MVSVVKCPDYEPERVYAAVKKSLGIIGFRFPDGKNVLIKPNLIIPAKPELGITTHPAVVEAVCRLAKEAGCRVSVGESSGFFGGGTERAFEECGIRDACKRAGVECRIFGSSGAKAFPSSGKVMEKIVIARDVLDTDLVVNIPKLKTHCFTTFTGAVKNLFGAVPGSQKQECHAAGRNIDEFSGILVDIYERVRPGLNIMDGVVGLEGDGPSLHGVPKSVGVIMASADALAMDIEAGRIAGFSPEEIPTTRIALGRGLLPGGPASVEVAGEKGLEIHFKRPGIKNQGMFRMFYSFINKRARSIPVPDPERCTGCGQCAEGCPVSAIVMGGGNKKIPEIERKKCIACYCCHELCPCGAMELRVGRLAKIIKAGVGVVRRFA
jgi:uncharacterized protein (DUF362 family)/ferredoxin